MQNLCSIFHFRSVLWLIGGILTLRFLLLRTFPFFRMIRSASPSSVLFLLAPFVFKKFKPDEIELIKTDPFEKNLRWACALFFALAFLAKISQWNSLQLNAQDFWLFLDLFEQMKEGGFLLSRFAPQAIGFVQHGSVHPTFSWALLGPFAIVFGSAFVCLVFNPLVFSLAGYVLGKLAKEKMESAHALSLSVAFLCSTQVGRVLMYDVHPEAAYPLFTFLFFYLIRHIRSKTLFFWILVVAFAGLKEDSFLVLLPSFFLGSLNVHRSERFLVVIGFLVACAVWFFQMTAVQAWVSGEWGPALWKGLRVQASVSAGALRGMHWSGLSDGIAILKSLIDSHGGLLGVLQRVTSFLFSKAWLSIVVLVPWVGFRSQFWILVSFLVPVYSLLDGPNQLWTYYSAIFLGVFWFCAANFLPQSPTLRSFFISFTLWTSLVLGGQSLDFYWPKKPLTDLKRQVHLLLPSLSGRGIVSPAFLSLIPLRCVYSDRFPKIPEDWEKVDFVLFAEKLNRFEMNELDIAAGTQFLQSPQSLFQLIREQDLGPEIGKLLLFQRRNPNPVL